MLVSPTAIFASWPHQGKSFQGHADELERSFHQLARQTANKEFPVIPFGFAEANDPIPLRFHQCGDMNLSRIRSIWDFII